MTKFCKKCQTENNVSEFGNELRAKDGKKADCKRCSTATNRAWILAHPGYVKQKSQRAYLKNSDKIKQRASDYYKRNKDAALMRRKLYYDKNKELIAFKNKQYRELNKESLKIDRDEYVKKNYKKVKDANKNWASNKLKTDPEFRLKNNMRLLLRGFARDKRIRTSKKLGYNHEQLLEALGRYPEFGEHIDHKIPVSWFNDMSIPHIINDLRNLQILDAKENSTKNNKRCHPVLIEYFELIKQYIKPQYLTKIKINGNSNSL